MLYSYPIYPIFCSQWHHQARWTRVPFPRPVAGQEIGHSTPEVVQGLHPGVTWREARDIFTDWSFCDI